jgi:CheY-like chemotaxis protein
MSLRYVEGPTPVLSESCGACSANVSTWTATTRVGSKEAEAGNAAGNCDGPCHREVVPKVAPAMPDGSAKFTPPESNLPRLEGMKKVRELPPRALVADDNSDLQAIFSRQLNLLGFEVVGVGNGRDAVDLALAACQAGNAFDLILMDLEMPIIDGYEATRRIRAGGYSGPILALSAHSSDDHVLDCIKMGCNGCICKPIEWVQLAHLIHRFVPGRSAPGPIVIPDH